MPALLLTVGHGTLDQDRLGGLLAGAGVTRLVDVRRHPGSRRLPHVSRDALALWLPSLGIAYEWQPDLGGRRRPSPTSPSVALRNEAFRGYADWMATAAFGTALDAVMRAAHVETTAVMCAEAVWWRCHRRLIADATVLLHGGAVEHLFHDGRLRPHAVTDGARRSGNEVVYDRLSPATPAGAPPPAAPGRPRPTPRGAPGRQEPLLW